MKTKIKKNSNDDEVVTRAILRESLQEFELDFGARIEKTLDAKIGELAIMIQKGFASVTKDIAELSARLGTHENYTGAAIGNHEIRLGKLEKKIK